MLRRLATAGQTRGRPLIPLFKSPVCLQLRDEVEVKTPRTLEGHALVLRTTCDCISVSVKQILKFHERVILALILVASFARPKISSQFLRASESFKICKDSLTKFVNFFLLKKARKVSNFTSQASNFMADTKPLLKFMKTLF